MAKTVLNTLHRPLEAAATPEQIALHGHIAVLLRRYAKETGMWLPDLNEHVLGIQRKNTQLYAVVAAKAPPSRTMTRRLALVMGVPVDFFEPQNLENPVPKVAPATLKVPTSWQRLQQGRAEGPLEAAEPATAMVTLPVARPTGRPPGSSQRVVGAAPPLTFQMNRDGTADVMVNVRLSVERATSLFRMLLEAGLHLDGMNANGNEGEGPNDG